jgi:hypothetical protein
LTRIKSDPNLGNSDLFSASLRHIDVPQFSNTYVIENAEKQKSHFYFSCSDNSWMELFRASLNRIAHQAASKIDKALAFSRKARMIENTVCYST